MRRITLLASLVFLSCAAPRPPSPRSPSPDGRAVIKVWIGDADLPKGDLLDGCNLWAPLDIRCVETSDALDAHLRVYADRRGCEEDGNGRHALAWAYPGGKIVFKPDCFKRFLRLGTDSHKYRLVMTHETGHELGIWDHVPSICDLPGLEALRKQTGDDDLVIKPHPSGRGVCGRAVMNPFYDSGLDALTEIDGLAFDIRDPNWRVVRSLAPSAASPEVPHCVYYED